MVHTRKRVWDENCIFCSLWHQVTERADGDILCKSRTLAARPPEPVPAGWVLHKQSGVESPPPLIPMLRPQCTRQSEKIFQADAFLCVSKIFRKFRLWCNFRKPDKFSGKQPELWTLVTGLSSQSFPWIAFKCHKDKHFVPGFATSPRQVPMKSSELKPSKAGFTT